MRVSSFALLLFATLPMHSMVTKSITNKTPKPPHQSSKQKKFAKNRRKALDELAKKHKNISDPIKDKYTQLLASTSNNLPISKPNSFAGLVDAIAENQPEKFTSLLQESALSMDSDSISNLLNQAIAYDNLEIVVELMQHYAPIITPHILKTLYSSNNQHRILIFTLILKSINFKADMQPADQQRTTVL